MMCCALSMERIEKTVFISYRRTNFFAAVVRKNSDRSSNHRIVTSRNVRSLALMSLFIVAAVALYLMTGIWGQNVNLVYLTGGLPLEPRPVVVPNRWTA